MTARPDTFAASGLAWAVAGVSMPSGRGRALHCGIEARRMSADCSCMSETQSAGACSNIHGVESMLIAVADEGGRVQ